MRVRVDDICGLRGPFARFVLCPGEDEMRACGSQKEHRSVTGEHVFPIVRVRKDICGPRGPVEGSCFKVWGSECSGLGF